VGEDEGTRRRGRPKGHRLSNESRERISAARKAQEAARRASLNESRCAGCGDVWRDQRGRVTDRSATSFVWKDGTTDMLCGFCRRTATDMKATSLRALWGMPAQKEH